MTDALQGYRGVIKVSTEAGQDPAKIAEVRNFSVMVEVDEIDVTSHESSGDEESIMGELTWSGTAEYLFVPSDVDQQALADVMVNRTKVNFEFYPHGESDGYGYLHGQGYIDEWEHASPLRDAVAQSLGLVGTGELSMWQGPYYPKVTAGLFQLDSTDTGLRFEISSGLFRITSSGDHVAVIGRGASSASQGLFALIAE